MQTVKISRKAAAAILKELETTFRNARVRQELESALRVSPKKKAQRRAARAKVEGKRATVRERRSGIRTQAERRAGGLCEACRIPSRFPLRWDHFFGRAREESLETTWLLCASCDTSKTHNIPNADHWWRTFIAHCEKHGYTAEAEKARRRLEGIISMREAGNE